MATHRVMTTDPKLLEFAWHVDPDGWKSGYTPRQREQMDNAARRIGLTWPEIDPKPACRRVACPRVVPFGEPERMEMRPLEVELRAGASAAAVVVSFVAALLLAFWVVGHAVDAVMAFVVERGWIG